MQWRQVPTTVSSSSSSMASSSGAVRLPAEQPPPPPAPPRGMRLAKKFGRRELKLKGGWRKTDRRHTDDLVARESQSPELRSPTTTRDCRLYSGSFWRHSRSTHVAVVVETKLDRIELPSLDFSSYLVYSLRWRTSTFPLLNMNIHREFPCTLVQQSKGSKGATDEQGSTTSAQVMLAAASSHPSRLQRA